MKTKEITLENLENSIGAHMEAGDFAGKYMNEAWALIDKEHKLPECSGDMWADIYMSEDGSKLYAVWAEGTYSSADCIYMEIQKEDCPGAFKDSLEKINTELKDLRANFSEHDTMYAPEDFEYRSEYATAGSARCSCGESRAIFFNLWPRKINKVIYCNACYRDAPANERFV